jgi:hypothetical protein
MARYLVVRTSDRSIENVIVSAPDFDVGQGRFKVQNENGAIGDIYNSDGSITSRASYAPTIPRLLFKDTMVAALGASLTETILMIPKFLLIYAGAENMDFADVFDTTDEGEPGYAKQLVFAGIVTQAQSDAFKAAWPRS